MVQQWKQPWGEDLEQRNSWAFIALQSTYPLQWLFLGPAESQGDQTPSTQPCRALSPWSGKGSVSIPSRLPGSPAIPPLRAQPAGPSGSTGGSTAKGGGLLPAPRLPWHRTHPAQGSWGAGICLIPNPSPSSAHSYPTKLWCDNSCLGKP